MISGLGWIVILVTVAVLIIIEEICDTYKETHKRDKDK